jgi:RND family efflux transporter MFP subunit
LQAGEQRLKQTRIVAPDDGIISSRTATIGAVVQSGQDLLRLIRGGRLEWRAEVTAADLGKIVPGQKATVRTVVGSTLGGTVRLVAPTIDPTTRNGIVYVDLPAEAPVRAGMFARGSVHVGESQAITLPQSAITLRDGYSYAYIVANDNRVKANKLHLGDWLGDRVDVLEGIAPGDRVVASGVGFLNDGDLVRIAYADAPAMAGTAKAQGSSADRQ